MPFAGKNPNLNGSPTIRDRFFGHLDDALAQLARSVITNGLRDNPMALQIAERIDQVKGMWATYEIYVEEKRRLKARPPASVNTERDIWSESQSYCWCCRADDRDECLMTVLMMARKKSPDESWNWLRLCSKCEFLFTPIALPMALWIKLENDPVNYSLEKMLAWRKSKGLSLPEPQPPRAKWRKRLHKHLD